MTLQIIRRGLDQCRASGIIDTYLKDPTLASRSSPWVAGRCRNYIARSTRRANNSKYMGPDRLSSHSTHTSGLARHISRLSRAEVTDVNKVLIARRMDVSGVDRGFRIVLP